MDLDKRKITVVQKLLATDQESIIEEVEHILLGNKPVKLSKEQKKMVDEALNSLESNGKILHSDVVRETDERYRKK